MMGIWFAANAIANYLAGILESLLAGSSIPLYWFLVELARRWGIAALDYAAAQIPHAWQRLSLPAVFSAPNKSAWAFRPVRPATGLSVDKHYKNY